MLQIREAAEELGYQADDMFCLKISQLREIFVVRWSVFLLGPAGCGKTAIWKTLLRAQQMFGEKSVFKPINPKVGPRLQACRVCRSPSSCGDRPARAVMRQEHGKLVGALTAACIRLPLDTPAPLGPTLTTVYAPS